MAVYTSDSCNFTTVLAALTESVAELVAYRAVEIDSASESAL